MENKSLIATKNNNNNNLVQNNNHEEYYLSVVKTNDDDKVYENFTLTDIKNSQITLVNKEVLVNRFSEKRIKDLDANYVGERIKKAINLSVFTIGYKVENLSEVIIMVIQDIFIDFSHLTISEIELAYRMGSRKRFGDIKGINVTTFYGWITSYIELVRSEAVKEMMMLKEKPIEVSDDVKKKQTINWIKSYIDLFNKYKDGDKDIFVLDAGNVFYDFCEKHNDIYKLNSEEKSEIWEKAKENIKNKHHRREAKSTIQAGEFKKILDSLNANDIDDSLKNRITSEAKSLAIPKIFDKIIEQGKNLEDFIDFDTL